MFLLFYRAICRTVKRSAISATNRTVISIISFLAININGGLRKNPGYGCGYAEVTIATSMTPPMGKRNGMNGRDKRKRYMRRVTQERSG